MRRFHLELFRFGFFGTSLEYEAFSALKIVKGSHVYGIKISIDDVIIDFSTNNSLRR